MCFVLAGRFGRKVVLIGGCAGQLVTALIAAFMPTFASFSVFRFLTSVTVTHAYLTAFVISKCTVTSAQTRVLKSKHNIMHMYMYTSFVVLLHVWSSSGDVS